MDKINSTVEVVYKIPCEFLYFHPFLGILKNFSHIMGAIDGLIYLILVYFIFCNRKIIWNDPALRIILLILFCYLLIWGVGIINFGAFTSSIKSLLLNLLFLQHLFIPKIPKKNKNYFRGITNLK